MSIKRPEFWWETKPEKIKNQKKFIVKVLRLHWKDLIREGGVSIAGYVGLIKNKKIKREFAKAIVELLADEKTENWIKEELEMAKKCLAADPNANYLNQTMSEEEFRKQIKAAERNRKRIKDSGKTQRKIDPAKVGEDLGAKEIKTGKKVKNRFFK